MVQRHAAQLHAVSNATLSLSETLWSTLRRHWCMRTIARLFLVFLMVSTFVIGSWAASSAVARAAPAQAAKPAAVAAHQQHATSSLVSQAWSRLLNAASAGSVNGGEMGFYTYFALQVNNRLKMEVNVCNGNLVAHASDLHIQGTLLDLSLERFYNSGPLFGSLSFSNWQLSRGADVHLLFNSDGSINFNGPSGYTAVFQPNGSGGFLDPNGLNATLTNTGSGYQLTFHKNGEVFLFDSSGRLTTDKEKNGNQIRFAYNGSSLQLMTSITDTQGRVTTLSYNSSGHVTTITDPTGRTLRYTYDKQGNLASSTDMAGQTTSYGYTASAGTSGNGTVTGPTYLLTSVTDPARHSIAIAYDLTSDTVTSITDATGAVTNFSYTVNSSGAPTTVLKDANGNQTTYTCDSNARVTQVTDALGHSRSTQYSPNDDVTQLTDALSNLTQFQFDVNNNITSATEATGAKDTFTYQDSSHPFYPTGSTDTQGNSLAYTYDAPGNLTSVKNVTSGGAGETTTYSYNSNGTLASMTDGNGHTTMYSYDSAGNLIKVTPPTPLGVTTLQDDGLSRTTSLTDGKGQATSYTYDALDRITKITYADGSTISYTYDAAGNVTSLTDNTGTTKFTYDADNRLLTKQLPGGAKLTMTYDAVGNLTSFADAGGTVTYSYNAVNLLSSLTDPSGAKTTYGYDNNNRRTSVTYPNGVTMTLSYDSAGHETGITAKNGSSTLAGYSYTYGTTDLRQNMTDQVTGLVSTYHYDTMNRLTEDAVTQGSTQSSDFKYSYDKAGNRTSQTINGTSTTFSYNAANELTSTSAGVAYTYDANGNLTGISSGNQTFVYNAKNQTTSMTGVSMSYTGTDQAERVQAGGTSYVNAPFGVSSQANSSGTTYFTRESNGTLTSERTSSGTYYYLFDGLGSVVGLTDSSGNLVGNERYVYDPYGNITNTVSSTPMKNNPWRFVSGYFDATTSLTKFGIRYDDTTTGRWTQRMPVGGSLQEMTKANPYACTADDPVNVVDPSGEAGWLCAGALSGIVLGIIGYIQAIIWLLPVTGALFAYAAAGSTAPLLAALAALAGIFAWAIVISAILLAAIAAVAAVRYLC